MNETIFLGLGSNVGDRLSHLKWAVREFQMVDGLEVVDVSSVYESEAHVKSGSESQSAYLNAVVMLRGAVAADELLSMCLHLEKERGRNRSPGISWEPRTLDLDILAYGEKVISSRILEIPHPRLAERKFVLLPWKEIAPKFRIPAPFNCQVIELFQQCQDKAGLVKTDYSLLD